MPNTPPILIVGAGPTGLTMAVELKRRNIPFRLIDKKVKPVKTSNALAVQTRTLEIWDDEYFLKNAIAEGTKLTKGDFWANNKHITTAEFIYAKTTLPFQLGLSQHHTEKMLIEFLKKKEIKIEANTELTAINQDENGITVTLQRENEEPETATYQWVIGCDGGKSIVRTQSNIDFVGEDLKQHFVLADVKLITPYARDHVDFFLSANGPLFIIPYDKDYFRIIADVTGDPLLKSAKELTQEQLLELVKRRAPLPFEMEDAIWTSGFWIHERLAKTYRDGNIFIAGDAAHLHSPAGGQGMNTGIQDAYNLAWKLALVINGKAKPKLLNTYELERYPIAKEVIKTSSRLTKIMTTQNSTLANVRNFLLTKLLKSPSFRRKLTGTLTELDIAYYNSPLTYDCYPHRSGPKPGERLLDVDFAPNARLIDAVRGTKFRLLIFAGESRNLEPYINLENKIKQRFPGVIKFILVNKINDFSFWDEKKVLDTQSVIHKAYNGEPGLLYLIRPDKYFCFRGSLEKENKLLSYLESILIPAGNAV